MNVVDEVLPSFLIVGTARSGTTSLYCWLKQHPEVFMPDTKEPSYFVHGYGISAWEKYLSLFEPGRGKKAIGEASVAYLWAPESPDWIYKMLGEIKIVILLREPVGRAISLYSWMVMQGYEWLITFEEALAEEEKRFRDESFRLNNPEYFWSYMYFRNGLYTEQVRRYLDAFGGEFVRIYLFEEIISSPAEAYRDVCDFLGVSTGFRPAFAPQNSSRIPRSITVQYLLRKLQTSSPRLPKGSRRAFQFAARQLIPLIMSLNKRAGWKPTVSPELKRTLHEMYRTDIIRLGKLIHRDLSIWLR
jgi:hypothetical protein